MQDFGAGIHQRLQRFSAEADRLVGNAEGPDKAATRRGRYASTERSLAEAVIESRLSERPSAESSIGGSAEDWQTMADTSISGFDESALHGKLRNLLISQSWPQLRLPLSRKSASFIVEGAARHISEEWNLRGGISLPFEVKTLMRTMANVLAEFADLDDEWGEVAPVEGARSHFSALLAWSFDRGMTRRIEELADPSGEKGWESIHFESLLVGSLRIAQMLAIDDAARRARIRVAGRSLAEWQRLHPIPGGRSAGMSAVEAEQWVCDWMLHMGAVESEVTRATADGGIDVLAKHYLAQVKLYTYSVSIAEIREFAGVASVDSKQRRALFFTSGTYPRQAASFANSAGMALFHFEVTTGRVVGKNLIGVEAIDRGLLVLDEESSTA